MRSAFLIACLMCQAAFGARFGDPITYVSFSRPDTSYATFMFDRNECLQLTSNKPREHYVEQKGGRFFGVTITYHIGPLVDCMTARGYVRDRDGYRAVGYQVDTDGNLWGVPMDAWR